MYSLLRCLLPSRLFSTLFLGSLTLTLGWGLLTVQFPATAQDHTPAQLVQTGVDAYEQGDYPAAIAAWTNALQTYPAQALPQRAQVNENLARAYQQVGNTTAAISTWEAAGAAYQQADNPRQYGRTLTEQAQVYISLGHHQRAMALLCDGDPQIQAQTLLGCPGGAYGIATSLKDATGQVTALGSLAETYRLSGDYDLAETLLQQGLGLVRAQSLPQYEAPLLNSLGNTYARQAQVAAHRLEAAKLLNVSADIQRLQTVVAQNQQQAQTTLQQAMQVADAQSDQITELSARLSLLAFDQKLLGFYQRQQPQDPALVATTTAAIQEARLGLGQLLPQLPPSRATAYAAITLAKSYQTSGDFDCRTYQDTPQAETWLQTGQHIAATIVDDRATSFALGELGHLAECRGNLEVADRLTNQAQAAASNALTSADSLYLWQWQLGRLYNRQAQPQKAMAAYRLAIATLESIRADLLTANRDLQFDFRDTVEPVYRQYIELQLAAATPATTKALPSTSSDPITSTLDTVDALRLAELQNFFGNDCVLVSSIGSGQQLLATQPQTTLISSVQLSNTTW